jgi:hypothetical protein
MDSCAGDSLAGSADPDLRHRPYAGVGSLPGAANSWTMKLPNGERADLGTKLRDYVLNPQHRSGRHKARVFASTLGIALGNAESLHQAIVRAAASSTEAEARGDNGHGDVYVLRFPLRTPQGEAVVLTAWIVRHGEDFPRLTTCYIV